MCARVVDRGPAIGIRTIGPWNDRARIHASARQTDSVFVKACTYSQHPEVLRAQPQRSERIEREREREMEREMERERERERERKREGYTARGSRMRYIAASNK